MIRILIIEDDENKRTDIEKVLERNGIHKPSYISHDNIQDGLNSLKEIRFDILILDLQLPQRSDSSPKEDGGVSILYKLSAVNFLTPTYIIGLTQYPALLEKYAEKFRSIDFNIFDYYSDDWAHAIKSKIEWIIASQKTHLMRQPDKDIYVLTHGIMTSGKWQDDLEVKLKNKKPNIKIIKYTYPYYSAFQILFPFLHRKAIKNYKRFVANLTAQYPNATLNFISHSFGTYLTINTLSSGDIERNASIGKIILCGSVLESDYDMASLIEKCQPTLIINDCGIKDLPLVLCNTVVWGLGNAGRNGFYGYSPLLKNRFFDGGHSYFFTKSDFMDEYWLPLIFDDIFIECDGRKKTEANDLVQSLFSLLPHIIISGCCIILFFLLVLNVF
ncbi:TPA: response regulator [Klebsiella oxytoca]|uniref:response regulator n=1 Tax=Citrobacter cronae TaxID=1748967 RepID=UPI0021D0D90A|nr:response regulator [Citrobacter cronae]MDQ5409069.1 response regulator [Klebsiella pneumoniae]HCJ6652643.1 response regulator [Klebsiella oxytoca]HCR3984991.1 response regulator [Kluyvera ascorbata]MCU6185909.1 response regulator [Citrobacter cronae]HCJ7378975.1 response regulator [Klebsiella oxytoca]